MPAIVTHHLFGNAMLAQLGGNPFPTEDTREAFLLGNQGPDPLFYLLITPTLHEGKKLGNAMHDGKAAEALSAMRQAAQKMDADEEAIANAYLEGFICHYTLDSTVHPFVFAWQYAIVGAGIEGLGEDAGSYVHSEIETDIDAALLRRTTGQTIATWRVRDHVLHASTKTLHVVDKLYQAATPVYSLDVAPGSFIQAVFDFRFIVALLHSPSGKRRAALGRLERKFSSHSIAQALSHRTDVGIQSDWDNNAHEPWMNPFTQEEHTESFDDLFKRAQNKALHRIEMLGAGSGSAEICSSGNFSGDPSK